MVSTVFRLPFKVGVTFATGSLIVQTIAKDAEDVIVDFGISVCCGGVGMYLHSVHKLTLMDPYRGIVTLFSSS